MIVLTVIISIVGLIILVGGMFILIGALIQSESDHNRRYQEKQAKITQYYGD